VKRIQCSMCLRMAQPSRRDAVICSGCSIKLYARLSAATGEDIDPQRITPHEQARGDSPNAHMGTVFEVRRAPLG
jgi:hypothetical protein